ncbi:GAP family protein [Leucobacter massiliensis]|uniref:GAP family protein n=1 Tax=Leucobacter massiliensis TaxID=1686285 RepID=A0A2S9QPI9_9MICO|nr:GAP family protein [Leucobacter massiliensis]PRI11511.1 hypothetical protein B4915_06705 [Leucobacter massiliensis]
MDLLNGLPLPLALAILALVDGLSIGTLLIPLFLLIAPGRTRVTRILLYLGTITVFYLAVGVLFMLGLVNVIDAGSAFLTSAAGQTVQFVAGAAMLAGGIWIGVADARRSKRAKAGEPEALRHRGRLLRWRDRLLAPGTSPGTVMAVAVAAGITELATMLPYLLGMTMLASSELGSAARFAMLAGYCLVMIAPVLLLLAARLLTGRLIEGPLQRFAAWMQRTGAENTSWIFGVVGFLLLRSAAAQLGIELPLIG